MDWGMKLTEGGRTGRGKPRGADEKMLFSPARKESQEKAMPGDNNGIRFALFKKT